MSRSIRPRRSSAISPLYKGDVHKRPGEISMLAYNYSPLLNAKEKPDDTSLACFQKELSELGYKLQLIAAGGNESMRRQPFNGAGDYVRISELLDGDSFSMVSGRKV